MNIKNICTAGFLAIAASGFAGQATAGTWAPLAIGTDDNPYIKMNSDEDRLKVGKGIVNLTCDLESEVEIDSNGNAFVVSISVSGAIFNACSRGTTFEELPYPLEGMKGSPGADPAMPDTVTIKDVVITTPIPNTGCAGDLIGTWNNSTGELTFTNATLPGKGGDCKLSGTLTTMPQASF